MFILFITIVMKIFALIFMKFFSFPLDDLGFNLVTLMIFLILLRFSFKVILSELILPTLGLDYSFKKITKIQYQLINKLLMDISKHKMLVELM